MENNHATVEISSYQLAIAIAALLEQVQMTADARGFAEADKLLLATNQLQELYKTSRNSETVTVIIK